MIYDSDGDFITESPLQTGHRFCLIYEDFDEARAASNNGEFEIIEIKNF